MTARMRFIRKNCPTMTIAITKMTATAGISTSMKFIMNGYQVSKLIISNTERRLVPR
jgi:hypothetical protein